MMPRQTGLPQGNVNVLCHCPRRNVAEWRGEIKIETRDLSIREIPAESRLAVGSQGFRGSVSIPEGKAAEVVFLPVRDGYLLQALPFRIEVKDFRIEHYPNGQQKSFESDLVIHDDQLAEPFESTIAVNHPLIYRGHSIYQSSFSDGGSSLSIDAWPLDSRAGTEPVSIQTKVFENRQISTRFQPKWGDLGFQGCCFPADAVTFPSRALMHNYYAQRRATITTLP